MDYEKFQKLPATQKWFYVWQALDNHLGQIKEIKWIIRGIGTAIGTGIVVSFVRFVIMK